MIPESVVRTYRWGVVAADEPAGVRTVRGFIAVLEFCTPSGAPLNYQLAFFNIDGRPLDHFGADDFPLFACAAGLAMAELGLPPHKDSPGHVAELIVLAQ